LRKRSDPHIEFFYASALYDPKYGLPTSINGFTKEHADMMEDMHANFINAEAPQFKTVGFFK
jgi:hypothetical protein